MAEHTCAEPPWTLAMRELEARLARGETPTLLEAAMACPPFEADAPDDLRATWVLLRLLALNPLSASDLVTGLLSPFLERRFAAELAALRLAQRITVSADADGGKRNG